MSAVVLVAACGGSSGGPTPAPVPTPPPSPASLEDVRLVRLASGFDSPVAVTGAPGSDRLFVVEQWGRIRVLENPESGRSSLFLDLSDIVEAGGELGLLGLAFPPDYARSGLFYVSYTDRDLNMVLSEFKVEPEAPNRALRSSERVVLEVPQDTVNHHGGMLAFGPDGALYYSLGDSAQGADPLNYAQDPSEFRGKILRVDPLRFPEPLGDNPGFANPHVWQLGLRNPWRFSFDRETGDFYVADVGEVEREEVSVAPSGVGGLNFGWRKTEGDLCFVEPWSDAPRPVCDESGLTSPAFVYGRDVGCSVTGGYVYRGPRAAPLVGRYVFADWCSNRVFSFVWEDGEARDIIELTASLELPRSFSGPTSFGEDRNGDLYIVVLPGDLFRVEMR
jgi:hypothetical protein